ncbi:hypothetical protein JQS43_09510 [Natronosporangium hydrolyticum]|uniref:Type IV toxin-antitoxin system AbiEi family antitoxin domain-containing protein n=1 Tax=Natronosporangium hydrolyticum TaxID=2811111 RepID=A0A895YF98_9ACTN|nr:hypothetical protein [Natronosporangium hydrolyticum]QSB16487.1 hypothetical protein JQS43_09510 [Natronosporangium hydrolyticum]
MDTFARLVASQDGLITQAQAYQCGLTRAALRWRLASGDWREILPHIYATVTGDPTARQRALAGLLYGGAGAQLTGGVALRAHGFRYLPTDPYVRILVPRGQQRRSVSFVALHRTDRPDPRPVRVDPLLLASPARAVADAARWCRSRRQVRAMVADAVQRRLTTVAALQEETARAARQHSALLRAAVAEMADGVRSVAESELRQVLGASRIRPPIHWNPHLVSAEGGETLPTPDGYLADVGVALEVDSREFHTSPGAWSRTMARHNLLARHGAVVIHLPPSRIRGAPASVLAEVEQVYLTRRATGATAAIRFAESDPLPTRAPNRRRSR